MGEGKLAEMLTMLITWIIAVAVVPPVERAELFGSRVLFGSSHCIELLGGPRCVLDRVDYIPTVDYTLVIRLEKAVLIHVRGV